MPEEAEKAQSASSPSLPGAPAKPFWWRYPPPGVPAASHEGNERLLIALTEMVRSLGEGQTLLAEKMKGLATNMAELEDAVQAIEDAVSKEGQDMVDAFTRLEGMISSGVPAAEVAAAVTRLKAQAQGLADLDAKALAEGQPLPPPPTP